MPYVVAEPCVGTKDSACVAVCPVDCIYEGDDQYYINPDECIDCGACEPECPVEAIFADDSVPAQWASFTEKNRLFFGAYDVGTQHKWGAACRAPFVLRPYCIPA